MTNHDAITKAISIITSHDDYPATLPIYPISRKKDARGECIVVNSLGFPSTVLQVGVVNVNIHVPDKAGLPDNKRMNTIAAIVRDAINEYSSPKSPYIDFEADFESVFQDGNNEHVFNLRFKATMLND